jgi:magnesium-transporting ATPase (P-type)
VTPTQRTFFYFVKTAYLLRADISNLSHSSTVHEVNVYIYIYIYIYIGIHIFIVIYIYIYIYIYKYLLKRNTLKYMWGYKIVPTTNLQHYHFMYSLFYV